MKRKPLGKGLDALLPGVEEENIKKIPIEKISSHPNQPRTEVSPSSIQELVNSIKEKGIIEPIIVRPVDRGYEIVAGFRRLLAAREVGLKTIPSIIKPLTEQESLELALIENLQREDLNPIEEAQAYKTLIEKFNLTHKEIALRVGKNRATITNTLRLLSLPKFALTALKEGKISEGHARVLLGVSSPQKMNRYINNIIEKGWSVRLLEKNISAQKKVLPKRKSRDEIIFEDMLKEKTGFPVEVRISRSGKGVVKLHFNSKSELKRFIEEW